MAYVRCGNCGAYLQSEGLVGNRYCSEACAEQFRACENCGTYFRVGTGYGDRFCCGACSIHYKINRFHEQTPLRGLSEELVEEQP